MKPRQAKRSTAVEVSSPRKLRTRRDAIPSNVSKEHQDAVFSIPELHANITAFLTQRDLKVLMLTCRAWYAFCVPALYKRLSFVRHSYTTQYPKIEKYGSHVQQLQLENTNVQGILHLVRSTPHLQQFDLSSNLTSRDLATVLYVVADELLHLKINQISRAKRCSHGVRSPNFSESMFHHVAQLHSLRSLQWYAKGMTIHVDDILRVLQACPCLVSLHLGEVNVIYGGFDSSPSQIPMVGRFDPPGPFVPIPATDLDALYSGHQLQELEFNYAFITDEGLLRLLGIDIQPAHNTIHRSPALIQLVINSIGPTHRSGTRILQECRQLEVIGLRSSRMATIELFQGNTTWPCAPFIKTLRLDIKVPELDSNLYYNHRRVADKGFPVLSTVEQHQIWRRLQSMVSLRHLEISG
ncbi:hypothetical protein BGZ81_002231, partial [Podila clonocystis]